MARLGVSRRTTVHDSCRVEKCGGKQREVPARVARQGSGDNARCDGRRRRSVTRPFYGALVRRIGRCRAHQGFDQAEVRCKADKGLQSEVSRRGWNLGVADSAGDEEARHRIHIDVPMGHTTASRTEAEEWSGGRLSNGVRLPTVERAHGAHVQRTTYCVGRVARPTRQEVHVRPGSCGRLLPSRPTAGGPSQDCVHGAHATRNRAPRNERCVNGTHQCTSLLHPDGEQVHGGRTRKDDLHDVRRHHHRNRHDGRAHPSLEEARSAGEEAQLPIQPEEVQVRPYAPGEVRLRSR